MKIINIVGTFFADVEAETYREAVEKLQKLVPTVYPGLVLEFHDIGEPDMEPGHSDPRLVYDEHIWEKGQ